MPSQQEHLNTLAQSFETLVEKLEPLSETNPDLKVTLGEFASSVRGLDIRLLNDERLSRVIEGADKVVDAMSRRARGGPGIISNRASLNVRDVQAWGDKLMSSVFSNYERNKPPETAMDVADEKRNAFIMFRSIVSLCQLAGLSDANLKGNVDQLYAIPADTSEKEFYISFGAVYLFALASNLGVDVESALATAQAELQKAEKSNVLRQSYEMLPARDFD